LIFVIINNELDRNWWDRVVVSGGTEKDHEKASVTIANLQEEL
jgi:hypothetical protein